MEKDKGGPGYHNPPSMLAAGSPYARTLEAAKLSESTAKRWQRNSAIDALLTFEHRVPIPILSEAATQAVHRSNNQNRDATPGQKAMAFAMQFPAGTPGKRTDLLPESKKLTGYEQKNISNARYILRNNPAAPNSEYPQYALDVMAGLMTLTEAYDATQKDMARREEFRQALFLDGKRNFLKNYQRIIQVISQISPHRLRSLRQCASPPFNQRPTSDGRCVGVSRY